MSLTAELLGIDMKALLDESPDSLAQLRNRRIAEANSEAYWDWRRVPERDEPLTITQVADRLFYSPNYVFELIKRGKLPAEKVNGRWMVDAKTVSDVLATRR